MKILHGFTGSVASVLDHKFKEAYEKEGWEVRYMATKGSSDFVGAGGFKILDDSDERKSYLEKNEVLHIDLTKWADVLVIAPCSANTLAKIANGFADNLVTCVCRAWDLDKPMLIAPSMNPKMWEHPVTEDHLQKLEEWAIWVVEPAYKKMFCGDVGQGAMAHIDHIITDIKRYHDRKTGYLRSRPS